MNKHIIKGFLLLLISCAFISCEETKEVDEFVNWQADNEEVIDSIANVFKNQTDGKWRRFKAYNNNTEGDPNENWKYIYVKDTVYSFDQAQAKSRALVTEEIFATDSVKLDYRGSRVDGVVYDQTYSIAEPDPNFVKPSTKWTRVDGFITGFTTALLHMKQGDRCLVYIPHQLGYGGTSKENIPAYSTLIFEIGVREVWRP